MHFKNIFHFPDRALSLLAIKLIKLYQATFSPDHSAGSKGDPLKGCKFYPSCSNYGIDTFKKYGFVAGVPKVMWRILRCHPWSLGGVDEVKDPRR